MSEKKQVLTAHLLALRKMLVISAIAVSAAFLLLFYFFCDPLVQFILAPMRERAVSAIYTVASEALMLQFKACLVAGVVVAMPVIIWQAWEFIAPALYPGEKKLFRILFFVALVLFLIGVCFSYLMVFPLAIDLFVEAGANIASPMWSVNQYFDFVLSFVLPFGVMFLLPVVIYMLARKGLVTYAQLTKSRRFVILGISIVAAFLTPPDVVSQVMLGMPMWLLFEMGVQTARLVKVKKPGNVEQDSAF